MQGTGLRGFPALLTAKYVAFLVRASAVVEMSLQWLGLTYSSIVSFFVINGSKK